MPAAVAAGCSQVVVISDEEDFSPAVDPTLLGHCMEGFWGFVCSVRSLGKMWRVLH